MKKIWKQTAGFTLVELIVVIAILGILAGVAVPAYSGYVTKANQAADEVLLSSVNTAFATACLGRGENNYGLSGVALDLDDAGAVAGVTGVSAEINTDFLAMQGGGAFKVYQEGDIMYKPALGIFTVAGDSSHATKYGTVVVSDRDKAAFNNGSELNKLTATHLLGEMDNVVTYASDYAGLLANVRNEAEFQAICQRFTGYDAADAATKEAIEMKALVLYTAGQYNNLEADTLYNDILANSGGYMTHYDTDGKDFAANAAMYALGMAYANTDAGKAIMAANGWSASDVDDIRDLMTHTPEIKHPVTGLGTGEYEPNVFITWLTDNKSEAMNSLESFGGAMNMLSGNKETVDMDKLLQYGFGDAEFAAQLEEALRP